MNMLRLFSVQDRTALVTGGNSGIGEAMATALGLGGARVILVARRQEQLEKAAQTMRQKGIDAHILACDLMDVEAAEACIQEKIRNVGHVDILVNAAGVNLRQPAHEITVESWNQQLTLHLTTPFFLTRALAPAMAKQQWGRIINIASLQSYRAFANSIPYGAAKGGVVQLTRAIAQEWSSQGITCNAIGPGFFPTGLTQPVFDNPALSAMNAAQTCIGRNGTLEDLYGVTLFLASEASAYITGQTIMLDGGFTAR